MTMHLVTQRDQPYGSVRTCCERCGVVPAEHSATDDEGIYDRQIDRCDNKPAVWPSDRLVPRSIEDVPMTFTVDGEQISTTSKLTKRCAAWSYPGHKSWDCHLPSVADGRQCALNAGHHGPHELSGPWTSIQSDAVNHPNHYGGDTVYETIKVIDAWGLDFDIGSAVKYLSRAGKKDPAKEIEDLRKAVWYIEHKIKRLSK